jgi:tRNA1(Val) A37 N6-methylase TrmN6
MDAMERAGIGPTEDKLLGGRVRLVQPGTGYRAAMDAVLLAAAVPAANGARVMDLGSGVGAASMCLASRITGCQIDGAEIQPHLVSLGEQNILLNGFEGRVRFFVADVSSLGDGFYEKFSHAMVNPPYLQASRAQPTDSPDLARIEVGIGLNEWVDAAVAVIQDGGTMTFIHRADRLDELLARIRLVAGDISVVPIWPGPGKEAKRVIVSARKGRRGPLRFCPGLTLHDDEGRYTRSTNQILYAGSALEF